MSEKFTPGEWVISTEDDDCFIVRDKDGGFVCYGGCFDPDNKSEVEDAKKDITLIAAAPEMYRLLQQLHGALQSVPILQAEIEKVFRKARGEE
jgi:glycine/D-amino acid oxidase-like deaminating enzyme